MYSSIVTKQNHLVNEPFGKAQDKLSRSKKSSVYKILRTQYANKMFNLKPLTMT
jgi:hypothetical protein